MMHREGRPKKAFIVWWTSLWWAGVALVGLGCGRGERGHSDSQGQRGRGATSTNPLTDKGDESGDWDWEDWDCGAEEGLWEGNGYWPWADWRKGPVRQYVESEDIIYWWYGIQVLGRGAIREKGVGEIQLGHKVCWIEGCGPKVMLGLCDEKGKDHDWDWKRMEAWDLRVPERLWAFGRGEKWVQAIGWAAKDLFVVDVKSGKSRDELVGLDLATGREKWRRVTAGDKRLAKWGGLKPVWAGRGVVIVGWPGPVLAGIDAYTGEVLWKSDVEVPRYECEPPFPPGWACSFGAGLYGDYGSGLLYGLRDGVWGGPTAAGPALVRLSGQECLCGGRFVLCDDPTFVRCNKDGFVIVEKASGAVLWREGQPEPITVWRAMSASVAVMLLPSDERKGEKAKGDVYAAIGLDLPTGRELWRMKVRLPRVVSCPDRPNDSYGCSVTVQYPSGHIVIERGEHATWVLEFGEK